MPADPKRDSETNAGAGPVNSGTIFCPADARIVDGLEAATGGIARFVQSPPGIELDLEWYVRHGGSWFARWVLWHERQHRRSFDLYGPGAAADGRDMLLDFPIIGRPIGMLWWLLSGRPEDPRENGSKGRRLRANVRGGLSSALVIVGLLALFGFIISLEIHNAIGTPTDTPLLLIGIALVFGGLIGWVLWQKLTNEIF